MHPLAMRDLAVVLTRTPRLVAGAVLNLANRHSTDYFFLRRSFILSPGVNSEAPLDLPVVESFILSPGANSEAPREVVVVELFIWVPGAKPEAPFVEPAKLRPYEPISIAAAAMINVFFMLFSLFVHEPFPIETRSAVALMRSKPNP